MFLVLGPEALPEAGAERVGPALRMEQSRGNAVARLRWSRLPGEWGSPPSSPSEHPPPCTFALRSVKGFVVEAGGKLRHSVVTQGSPKPV